MNISPLEQFFIFPILSITSINLYLILVTFSIISFTKQKWIFSKHIEWFYSNLKNVENNLFILLTIWMIILFSNLLGMIPYCSTITSQIVIILSLSLPIFIGININGFKLHSYNILYLFLPSGVPFILIPLLTILEFISYTVRVLSLTLRLAANLIAGHILIKILLYASIDTYFFIALLFIPIVTLELGVAILQSYIFLTLVLSYYKDIFMPH